MTPERWKQIRSVYEEAELLSPPDRLPYLDRACTGDSELRREVESLLQAQSQAGSEFMGRPAADLVQPESSGTAAASRVDYLVGPYRIVEMIGRGGMGEVYRADRIDGQFEQQVAIKLVRVGLDSTFIVNRFLHERQILASLNHPNITRLLDGGATSDGVPYLVMELIEGERIDTYCQANRLSITERLRLFLQVCAAVQYAHQHLVIHRDIKPGNIFVTKDGTPKLLDFGIAKILDPVGDSETTLARPMTPEYASPEQILGHPVTTASDVFTLGVVLYQLLTGRYPYRNSTGMPSPLSRVLPGTDPQRPSTAVMSVSRGGQDAGAEHKHNNEIVSDREPTPARLRKRLSGDLDSILLMALRREPEKRYGSVQQFAEDISRHLNGLPVTATKGSWSYSAGKFVARHRAAVAATAFVILALVAGIAATQRQARIARAERAKAQKRFDDVRTFSDSLIFDINEALQDVPGTTPARKLLLDRASQYLDRVASDAEGDSGLQRELAHAYQRLAMVQGDATVSNVGEVSAAELSSRKAIALFESVARANPTNTDDQLNVAIIHLQKGYSDVYYPAGRPEIERALAITEPLLRSDGRNPKVLIERAIELQALGDSLDVWGDRQQSAEKFRQSLELVQTVAQLDPEYKRIGERLAKARVKYGFQLALAGQMADAENEIKSGIDQYARVLPPGASPDKIRDLAQSRARLAYVQMLRGEFDSAQANLARSRDAVAPLAKADPHNIMLRMDMINLDFQAMRALVLKGRSREAEPGLANLVSDYEKLDSEEDSGPGLDVLYQWLGEAQMGSAKFDAAITSFQKSIEKLAAYAANDDAICGIMTASVRTGDALLKLGRRAEAEAAYSAALTKLDAALAAKRQDMPGLMPLAAAHAGLGELRFAAASLTQDSGERDRLRTKGCEEYRQARELNKLVTVPWTFNPTNFLGFRTSPAALPPACTVAR